MELVLALVDATIARHESPYLFLTLLNALRQATSDLGDRRLRQERHYFRIDE